MFSIDYHGGLGPKGKGSTTQSFIKSRKQLPKNGMTGVGNPTSSEELEQLKKNVRDIIKYVRFYGVKTVYFYGLDEVQGNKLKSQRPG